MSGPAAAYLHLPFCARLCPYCDFAVVTGRTGEAERYVAAVEREIAEDAPGAPLEAVFIGGGTPTAVAPELIARLLEALERQHGFALPEISLESNPEHLDAPLLEALAAAGVNRLSIGAQSFDAAVLAALGRVHAPEDIARGVLAARDAGVPSVSVDLIFGHPAEDAASWDATLDAALATGVDHVSTYALTVERGTSLSRSIAAGAPAPDEDEQADRYEAALARLGAAGFVHYEVSNHAKPGHRCRYNEVVWAGAAYLAYGLGAHGYRDGARFRNVRAFDAYVSRIESGESPRAGIDRLSAWEREVDRFMIGLRLRSGVLLGDAGERFVGSPPGRRLVDLGVLLVEGDVARVADPLFTDAVAREVVGINPGP